MASINDSVLKDLNSCLVRLQPFNWRKPYFYGTVDLNYHLAELASEYVVVSYPMSMATVSRGKHLKVWLRKGRSLSADIRPSYFFFQTVEL